MKRWWVVLGALLIQMNLGAVYAWSLFNKPLMDKFGWEREDVVVTFSITIATFALATIAAGRLQDRIGPRKVATIGGLLLGVGLMLSGQADTLLELYFYYGVIGGIGIGTAYVCPLSACIKWFPDKPGLIGGLAVAGFGAGGLIYKPVIGAMIESVGVSASFVYLGIVYMVLVIGGAQLLLNPAGQARSLDASATGSGARPSYKPKEMLATRTFYIMWAMFFFGTMAGLMVISFAVDIGVEMAGLSAEEAANAVMFIALFNALGRILLGKLSDHMGRKNTLLWMYGLTAAALLFMSMVPMTDSLFMISVSLIGFCFGGFLAVYPSLTADYYGTGSLGANYGLVYQAYGLSAFVGPIIVRSVSFTQAFFVAALCCVIAIVLANWLRIPEYRKASLARPRRAN
ncbi:MFS transporter [Paenibacillus sambharensis]|uniref:MFS transporter n=1 Tax=Paenibacillus sambharensis TaxID=1803190 RepID=A0A2W1L8M3_9BACL|nr:OFA family MFS transporter [Paenibacillus sambharensis]PZD95263.1 MFS transporter [Paenibacillus sambharensis]